MSKRIALLAAFSVCAALGLAPNCFAVEQTDASTVTAAQHNAHASELVKQGRWTEAIDEFEQAITQEPNNKSFKADLSSALLRCGDVLMGKKNYKRAAELYKRALEADNQNLSAKSALNEAEKLASNSEPI